MKGHRPSLFQGDDFADDVIVLCVRWYVRYSLSYRVLAEMMVERHLSVDASHDLEMGTTIGNLN